jgi:hypothetical protein
MFYGTCPTVGPKQGDCLYLRLKILIYKRKDISPVPEDVSAVAIIRRGLLYTV